MLSPYSLDIPQSHLGYGVQIKAVTADVELTGSPEGEKMEFKTLQTTKNMILQSASFNSFNLTCQTCPPLHSH